VIGRFLFLYGESLGSLSSFNLLLKKEKSQTFEYTKNFDTIESLFFNSLYICVHVFMYVTLLVLIVLGADLHEYLIVHYKRHSPYAQALQEITKYEFMFFTRGPFGACVYNCQKSSNGD
jgi:hypothetical protein